MAFHTRQDSSHLSPAVLGYIMVARPLILRVVSELSHDGVASVSGEVG